MAGTATRDVADAITRDDGLYPNALFNEIGFRAWYASKDDSANSHEYRPVMGLDRSEIIIGSIPASGSRIRVRYRLETRKCDDCFHY
jgi:hypothetical protein